MDNSDALSGLTGFADSILTTGHAYMKRALQLSVMGAPRVSPNPMVGAVIVADGRIIGEGYHRIYGQAHAEVNAVASVKEADRPLLTEATMYVTLEPCSHFGKTPPCADLILRERIPKVVIATADPFLKDYESGIDRLRKAGVDVEVGMMEKEARFINRRFFTAHTLKRPFVLLKWAQTADGFIAGADGTPVQISDSFTRMLMHRERSMYDAIMVGASTILIDNPRLSCRLWPSSCRENSPLKVSFDSTRLRGESIVEREGLVKKGASESLQEFLHRLYVEYKITSLMVEGGSKTLESFFREGLFDEVRIETGQQTLGAGIRAPRCEPYIEARGLRATTPRLYSSNLIQTYIL